MPYPSLSPGAVAEIVCRYRRGESTPQIARALHLTNSTVVSALEREGVERRRRGGDTARAQAGDRGAALSLPPHHP